ncbi:MAG TPA: hypothetical protein VFE33_12220 [Thermoanaerobaculia bacterium]|nr:hypothetical protein [Thermoanaerobaculia bacterium]
MDPELIAYLERRFGENAQQISTFRDETVQRFEKVDQRFEQIDRRIERVEETGRQTRVLIEDLRGEVNLVAEGFAGLNDRLERLKSEVAQIFGQVKAWFEPYLRHLDSRIRSLESRAERQQGDIL